MKRVDYDQTLRHATSYLGYPTSSDTVCQCPSITGRKAGTFYHIILSSLVLWCLDFLSVVLQNKGLHLKKRNFLLEEQITSFKSWPPFQSTISGNVLGLQMLLLGNGIIIIIFGLRRWLLVVCLGNLKLVLNFLHVRILKSYRFWEGYDTCTIFSTCMHIMPSLFIVKFDHPN